MTKIRLNLVSTLILAALLLPTTSLAAGKIVRRAAFDIGSHTTKVKVADVDTDTGYIVEVVLNDQRTVNYVDDFNAPPEGRLSEAVISKGINELKALKAEAAEAGAQSYFAVATSIFSRAENAKEAVQRLKSATGIPVKPVDQKEEAMIGFYGVLQNMGVAGGGMLAVWDIGGGNMQLCSSGRDGRTGVYLGDLASINFRNLVIEQIQKKNPEDIVSPNPLGKNGAELAVKAAKEYAFKHVPNDVFEDISEVGGNVVGIGGVFMHSLPRQTGKTSWTREELMETLMRQAMKTDDEIGSKYATTDVTNLALVVGFMRALGIRTVKSMDINEADGVLTMPQFWLGRE